MFIWMPGQEVQQSTLFKYFDMVYDETLSFNEHVEYVKSKVSETVG